MTRSSVLVLLAITAFFHLVVPVAAALLLARSRPKSAMERALAVAGLAAYGLHLVTAGAGWLWFGTAARWTIALVVAAGVAAGALRVRGAPVFPRGAKRWIVAALKAAPAVFFGVVALSSLARVRRAPAETVDLALPLEPGTYGIAHGGAHEVFNVHADVRTQTYALDILRVRPDGRRASALAPRRVEAYESYGARVLAPCSGTVLTLARDVADAPPFVPDKVNVAGNHVALHCEREAITVLVAHLAPGTVKLEVGARVHAGDLVGLVGNTGHTTEPHLHIHAVRGKVSDVKLLESGAEPAPVRFGGRFWIRNDTMVVPPRAAPETLSAR
jgi:hypothetical protein